MTDLFETVLHHIEGSETKIENWQWKDGPRSYAVTTFGPDRWIERAALGRLMAIDVLAVILLSVGDTFDLEHERRIVESWSAELRKAATDREIRARDPVTLLALESVPSEWEWLLLIDDADRFVASRGMPWSCSEQVAHLLEETRRGGKTYCDPVTGRTLRQEWLAGYEPKQTATDTSKQAGKATDVTSADRDAPAVEQGHTPDAERRLARLRALGGSAKYTRARWSFTRISVLVESEKSEGRARSDEKTIRADLREAAQAERDAKSAGFGAGLGQR